MTKKSLARQMRDRQAGEIKASLKESMQSHPIWDEVANLSSQILSLIASYSVSASALEVPEIAAEIKDPKSLVSTVNILAMDLKTITGDIMNLRRQHANKSGAATTPEEHMAGIQIHQEYVTFMERIEGVIQPTYQELMRQISEAEAAAREKSQAFSEKLNASLKTSFDAMTAEPQLSPEQDPNVISDAVVINKN